MNMEDSMDNPTSQTDAEILRRHRLNQAVATRMPEDIGPGDSVAQSGYIDIVQFFRIILNNLWVVLIVAIAGTAIAYLVVDSQTEIYQTEASLVVLPNADENAIPQPIQELSIALGTYVQLLRSNTLATNVYILLQDQYSADQLNNVSRQIRPVENSSIVVVTVQSENAQLAQDYANEVVNQITNENPIPEFEFAYRAEVLDRADLPTSPAYPDKDLSVALGAIGSLILGVLAAFLIDTYIKARRRAKDTAG